VAIHGASGTLATVEDVEVGQRKDKLWSCILESRTMDWVPTNWRGMSTLMEKGRSSMPVLEMSRMLLPFRSECRMSCIIQDLVRNFILTKTVFQVSQKQTESPATSKGLPSKR